MKDSFRSFLAIALSIGVLILWYKFIAPPPKLSQPIKTSQESPVVQSKTSQEMEMPKRETAESGKEVVLENELVRVSLKNQGGVVAKWELKKFAAISLAEPGGDILNSALQIEGLKLPTPLPFEITKQEPSFVEFRWMTKGLTLFKKFKLAPHSYQMELEEELINHRDKTIEFIPSVEWGKAPKEETPQRGVLFFKSPPDRWQAVAYKEGAFATIPWEKMPLSQTESGKMDWIGAQSHYFLGAVVPLGGGAQKIETGKFTSQEEPFFFQRLYLARTQVLPGEHWVQKFKIFGGPKDIGPLREMGPGFEKAIGYGWTTVFALPILHLLKLFYRVVHNYGVAIILLTILIKILLNPINRKSLESMKKMQALQPKLKEIREKFGQDKERLNREMMGLFKTHKINPMGGCLPMAVQIPIYIALYKVLWGSVELYHTPFFWFYKDLSAPDPYLITPILLGVTMLIQTKMTPQATMDPAQQKMMLIMPLMFCGFMIFLPMGLGLYILVNTVMTILQQKMYQKGLRMRDLVLGRFSGG